jgi:hypothetical protein
MALCVGAAGWGIGDWLARPRGGYVRLVAASAVGAVGMSWAGRPVFAGAILAAVGAAVIVMRSALRERADLVETMEWTAEGIRGLVGEKRTGDKFLFPTWDADDGLPLKWRYPKSLNVDAKKSAAIAAVFTERLGQPVSLTWKPKEATITPLRVNAPKPESRERRRLVEILDPVIPDVRIDSLTRDENGKLEEFIFSWPPRTAQVVSKKLTKARLGELLFATLGHAIVLTFDEAHDRAIVTPEVKRDLIVHPKRVKHDTGKAVFGVYDDDTPAEWNLEAQMPHVLISGVTQQGKTTLLMSLLFSLPENVVIKGIDAKMVSLKGLEYIPGGSAAVDDPAAIVETLVETEHEMYRRLNLIKHDIKTRKDFPHWVLVMEEMQSTYTVLNHFWKTEEGKSHYRRVIGDPEAKFGSGGTHPVLDRFTLIMQMAGEAGVHVISVSQQPGAKWMGTDVRDQYVLRIGLGNQRPQTSRMMFDSLIATSGIPDDAVGRAWVSPKAGAAPRQAQIYFVPKIEKGLSERDRAVLRSLGVTPPDERDGAVPLTKAPASTQGLVDAPVEPEDGAVVASGAGGAPVAAGGDLPSLVETSISELEAGDVIVIEHGGREQDVTVESLDADTTDDDGRVVVGYVTADGSRDAVSMEADERVSVLV